MSLLSYWSLQYQVTPAVYTTVSNKQYSSRQLGKRTCLEVLKIMSWLLRTAVEYYYAIKLHARFEHPYIITVATQKRL